MTTHSDIHEFPGYRTCSNRKEPAGSAFSRSTSLPVCSSHAGQSERSSTTIWRSWIGATSGLGSVVSSVKASPPVAMGRHRPAKQNQSSPAFVNFHFVFGDFVPVNSKKCDAGTRHRPTGELSTLRTEIDDRRTLWAGGRKAPPQLRKLVCSVLETADDGGRDRSARYRRAVPDLGPR